MNQNRLKTVSFFIALIALAARHSPASTSAEEPWIDLFNGRTTDGWTARGEAEIKVVENEIHLTAKKNVWVVTDRAFADFILEAEVKVAGGDGVNSGIAFRCQGEKGKPRGFQCEIDASGRAWTGGLHAIGAGWIHPENGNDESVQAFLRQSKGSFKRDDWNGFRIHCQGDRIRISVNGVLTTDVRDAKFQRGFIGIQHHGGGGVHRFRRIRVKPIDTIDFKAAMPAILPKEGDEALRTFKTRSGFRIEQVAAEPLVRDPIAIAFDENGRMFVVEFPEYNHKHAGWQVQRSGVVRMLEDTDQDGRFDCGTVYADQLSSPTGVACYDGGILVAAAPEILFCKDTDGDGRADVRKVLFTGFGISENRGGGARLNSIRWGLDHRFHLSTSFSGGEVRQADDEKSDTASLRNRGFAFDPRTLAFESTSGNGQHGLAIDDWGQRFTCNNSDPFKQVMYESRYLQRNPHVEAPPDFLSIAAGGKFTKLHRISRVQPWRVLRTQLRTKGLYRGSDEGGAPSGFFTSSTGVTVYRGDAWPEEYGGNIFIGEVSNNLVHRAKLIPKGIEFVAQPADDDAEFLASSDMWFRPVELANAPDGTLYVVDMYRELIETALALPPDVLKQLNHGGGVRRGRIYRIVPEGFKQRPLPKLGEATTDRLVSLIEHRNGWHRDTASRLLYERRDRSAVTPLRALAGESQLSQGRMTALYCLDALDALDAETVLKALDDSSEGVRVHAVRLAEQLATSTAIRVKLISMTDDPSLNVRYQLAFSLGECKSPAALAALAKRDAGDRWIRFAVLTSLSEGAGQVFAMLLEDEVFRQSAHGREFLNTLARQIGAANQKNELAAIAKTINALSEKPLQHAMLRSLIERQDRSNRRQILANAGSGTRQILDELLADARVTAGDRTLSATKRATAIRSLGLDEFRNVQTLFSDLLDPRQPPTVQSAALETLGGFSDAAVAELVLKVWRGLSPQLRAQATETLLSRRVWVSAFLDAVQQGKVARGDVDPARIALLRRYPSDDIRRRVDELFQAVSSQRAEVIKQYQPALQLTGDRARGKAVFKQVCSKCHKLEGVGTALGAELTAIRDRGPAALLLNILDPNREVKPKFLTYVIATNDGRVLTGMIQSENANSVVLQRADGTSVAVQRTEIEELRSTGLSFMAEGLEKELNKQAMADLLEYLANATTGLQAKATKPSYKIATFRVDITCPLGHPLLARRQGVAKSIADPLYAHGITLLGAGRPIVLAAIDWCEIRNDAYDHWRDLLAKAADTTPGRVVLCAVHQHDAPLPDIGAQKLLDKVGLTGEMCDLEYYEQTGQRIAASLRDSLKQTRSITHLGLGQSKVDRIASNRRVVLDDGTVTFRRGSNGGTDRINREAPEGLIDPWLKTISFWDGDQPVAAISAYATHPMSHYGRGAVSADFVGLARELRRRDDVSVHQMYVSGCSGDVTAGKYNDASEANRAVLAQRLYNAMRAAWKSTRRVPIRHIALRRAQLDLEFRKTAEFTEAAMQRVLNDKTASNKARVAAAMGLSTRQRIEAGRAIDMPCIDFGPAQIVLFPGESFVGYQILAQKMRPDSFVMSIGYGQCWPGYLPTESAFEDKFDGHWLWVAPGAEARITAALQHVLLASE